MRRFLLHYVDENGELNELNYFDAKDIDDAYRQALPIIGESIEYQLSEI